MFSDPKLPTSPQPGRKRTTYTSRYYVYVEYSGVVIYLQLEEDVVVSALKLQGLLQGGA